MQEGNIIRPQSNPPAFTGTSDMDMAAALPQSAEGVYQLPAEPEAVLVAEAEQAEEKSRSRSYTRTTSAFAALILLAGLIAFAVGTSYLAKRSNELRETALVFAAFSCLFSVGILQRRQIARFAYAVVMVAIVIASVVGIRGYANHITQENAQNQQALNESRLLAVQYQASRTLNSKEKAILAQQITSQQQQLRIPLTSNGLVLADLETLVLPVDLALFLLLPYTGRYFK